MSGSREMKLLEKNYKTNSEKNLKVIHEQYHDTLSQEEMTVSQKILLELCYNVGSPFRITIWHLGIWDADLIPWSYLLINLIENAFFF